MNDVPPSIWASGILDTILGFGLVYLLVGLALYFVPWFVALKLRHPNTTAIFFLNLLLGWSLIGWVAALVWALLRPSRVQPVYTQLPPGYAPLPPPGWSLHVGPDGQPVFTPSPVPVQTAPFTAAEGPPPQATKRPAQTGSQDLYASKRTPESRGNDPRLR